MFVNQLDLIKHTLLLIWIPILRFNVYLAVLNVMKLEVVAYVEQDIR